VSPPELNRFIYLHPPGRALDLGCGSGTNVQTLAQAGWQVIGVDFAWRAVHIARRRLGRSGVQADIRLGDVTDLKKITGQFDLILDIGCYHNLHPQSRKAYQDNLSRLLATGGTFMLYAHYRTEGMSEDRGVSGLDEEQFCQYLRLINRKVGEDMNKKPSVWLTYQLEKIHEDDF
jgi:cyclopropane fatty-acyl-phospholipid synthase-like methyltransferase